MSSITSTATWAHRTIRPLERFLDVRDEPSLVERYGWAGELVGVYFNPETVGAPEVVVTEQALIVCSEGARRKVSYSDIDDIQFPEKGAGGSLVVRLRDGRDVRLTIAGRQSRFEDVFEFGRFLQRVTTSVR